MRLGRVIGSVVSTRKHEALEGAKLLLVQPLTAGDEPSGPPLLAIDAAQAGAGDKVLVVLEGRAAVSVWRRPSMPRSSASSTWSMPKTNRHPEAGVSSPGREHVVIDRDLQAAVDLAIQRHLQRRSSSTFVFPENAARHPSHARFVQMPDGDGRSPCLIEPAVTCVHFGYCQSYEH